jgi:hypothetical protein
VLKRYKAHSEGVVAGMQAELEHTRKDAADARERCLAGAGTRLVGRGSFSFGEGRGMFSLCRLGIKSSLCRLGNKSGSV